MTVILKLSFIVTPHNLTSMVCLCSENLDHPESNLVELSLVENIWVVFKMGALNR